MSEEKIDYGMPDVPKDVEGSASNPAINKLNEVIKYITWLGRHFTEQDNFICEKCHSYYQPNKEVCPKCYPGGPNKGKR